MLPTSMMMIPDPSDIGNIPQQTIPAKQYQRLQQFWYDVNNSCRTETNFKSYQLPLARIKKIMKSDKDVKMISQEAPVLFAKACEIFIRELTLRAWMQTEENKRKTLQRNDIAAAISKTDMFDFLIDIVPREDIKISKKIDEAQRPPELQQYFYQLQQQMPDRVPLDMMYYQQQLQQQQQYNHFLTQHRFVNPDEHHHHLDTDEDIPHAGFH